MGARAFHGKASAAVATLTRTAEEKSSTEPQHRLLTSINTHFRVVAVCGACGRRTPLDMRRMLLRSDHGATLGGLRARLRCQSCHSRRTRLELSLTPRD